MKVSQHIEKLLKQGHKPKELVELGFPKHMVTRVRRQLAEAKAEQARKPKEKPEATSSSQTKVQREDHKSPIEERLAFCEGKIQQLGEGFKSTPALNLKNRFTCDCGATGLVALHIRCTNCGRETWWGWFPK